MRCRGCGHELPDEARFCLYCGMPVASGRDAGGSGADPAAAPGAGSGSDPDHTPDPEELDLDGLADPDEDLDDEPTEAVEAIPSPVKLEEPLSPLAAGAVPMVSAAPPRAMRVTPRIPRPYVAPSDRMASRSSRASIYQPRLDMQATHAAPGASAAEQGPSERGALSRIGADLKALGARIAHNLAAVEVSRKLVVAGVAAVCLIVAVVVCARFATSWIGPWAPEDEPAPEVEAPSDGSIEPIDKNSDDDGQDDQELPSGSPSVKSAVEDYSWEELSQIGRLISAAESDEAGLQLAKAYHLCGTNGKLDGTQTKKLKLEGGVTVTMQVAGFRQDRAADGKPAGISLVAKDSAAAQEWDAYARTTVGWEGSTLREWMNKQLVSKLPSELQEGIIQVQKLTNPPAGTGQTGQQKTVDALWVPSYSELVGKLGAGSSRVANYTSEGDQYQLFKDEGVVWGQSVADLGLGGDTYWWLRSPDVNNGDWVLCVDPGGLTSYAMRPANQNEVLIGFCL